MIDDPQLLAALRASDLLDRPSLERALTTSRRSERALYDTLLERQLVDEDALVRLTASIINVPFVDLGDAPPEPDALTLITPQIASRRRVLPLRITGAPDQRALVLAMADPLDVDAMDHVAAHSGIDIRPVLAAPADLERALRVAYNTSKTPPSHDDVIDLDVDELLLVEHDDTTNSEAPPNSLEDSVVLSRDMRDRHTSSILGPLDLDDPDDSVHPADVLDSLEKPLSRSQITGGVVADLSQWDIDLGLDAKPSSPNRDDSLEKDYAAIGTFFVYSSEKARSQRLHDLGDFDDTGLDVQPDEPGPSPTNAPKPTRLDERPEAIPHDALQPSDHAILDEISEPIQTHVGHFVEAQPPSPPAQRDPNSNSIGSSARLRERQQDDDTPPEVSPAPQPQQRETQPHKAIPLSEVDDLDRPISAFAARLFREANLSLHQANALAQVPHETLLQATLLALLNAGAFTADALIQAIHALEGE